MRKEFLFLKAKGALLMLNTQIHKASHEKGFTAKAQITLSLVTSKECNP